MEVLRIQDWRTAPPLEHTTAPDRPQQKTEESTIYVQRGNNLSTSTRSCRFPELLLQQLQNLIETLLFLLQSPLVGRLALLACLAFSSYSVQTSKKENRVALLHSYNSNVATRILCLKTEGCMVHLYLQFPFDSRSFLS